MATTNNVRYFCFAERVLRIVFFDDDPIVVTMGIDDDTAAKIDALPDKMKKAATYKAKLALVESLIGAENAANILDRADQADVYALDQIILFVQRSYIEGRTKNLQAAATGRVR